MDAAQNVPNGIPLRNDNKQRGPMAGRDLGRPAATMGPVARQDPRAGAGRNVADLERLTSVLGGAALVGLGLWRRKLGSTLLGLLGIELIRRGVTGRCQVYRALGVNTARSQPSPLFVEKTVTVNRPQEQVFGFFRNLENLPHFMQHLEAVKMLDQNRSHWVARAPGGGKVEWDAQIIDERPNQILSWRSLPDADVDNEGTVRFNPAPGGRGTEVKVQLLYNPPGGRLGALFAKLLGEEPSVQIEDDLHHLKEILEAGEIPTTVGQPSGRRAHN